MENNVYESELRGYRVRQKRLRILSEKKPDKFTFERVRGVDYGFSNAGNRPYNFVSCTYKKTGEWVSGNY